MSESVKRLFEYLIAGIILWLLIEEIKKFRANKKLRAYVDQSANLSNNLNIDVPDTKEQVKDHGTLGSRTIVYN